MPGLTAATFSRRQLGLDGNLRTHMSGAWIHSYDCTSAAGPSTDDFWRSLQNGVDHSQALPIEGSSGDGPASVRACLWKEGGAAAATARERLVAEMRRAFEGALDRMESSARRHFLASTHLGVILASTKSFVDDYVWHDAVRPDDAFGSLLRDFVTQSRLTPVRTIAVSNACASSLSALFLARRWLESDEIRDVIVIAADRTGPFIARGFHSLHAVTADRARPFSAARNGLQLGEAAAAILLSSTPGRFNVDGVAIDAEGSAVTRHRHASDSLTRACLKLPSIRTTPPDLIIAHGTATRINDGIEDQVFCDVFDAAGAAPPITGSKWCIGHTMGASGAMDVIAACEVMAHQQAFRIANTSQADPAFRCRYLTAGSDAQVGPVRRVLITSLAFGGIHAAATVTIA
jgi:3-oxoacyl-[acyl-carrier-protein] synthase-1